MTSSTPTVASLHARETPDGTALRVRGLTAGYDGVAVVRDVDLEVSSGEVVALLGPNGAGKTTTLLAISGLLPRFAGTVWAAGNEVSTRNPQRSARRGLAHVPEDRSLFFGLSTRVNLQLGTRRPKEDVPWVLEFFPSLERHLETPAGALSGGEQQMLALARALVGSPKLLMVDEMSLGLAPIVIEQLVPTLREVADRTGVGVLVVEQHVHIALEIADRGYTKSRGRIDLEGSTHELRAGVSELTARYLGGDESKR